MASLIMGCWFVASATGNFVAGMIARATGSEAASGSDAAQEVVLEVYSKIGWIAIAVGVGFLVISPLIKKLTHLDTLKDDDHMRSEEHTSELQSLMRISYAVFCLKQKHQIHTIT